MLQRRKEQKNKDLRPGTKSAKLGGLGGLADGPGDNRTTLAGRKSGLQF